MFYTSYWSFCLFHIFDTENFNEKLPDSSDLRQYQFIRKPGLHEDINEVFHSSFKFFQTVCANLIGETYIQCIFHIPGSI
jgi:hypothetical protein